MRTTKVIGYYLLWCLYYLICFFIFCLVFRDWGVSLIDDMFVSALNIVAILSPIIVARYMINKRYFNNDKKAHAKRWADTIGGITLLLVIGASYNLISRGFSFDGISMLPYFTFNACLVLVLFKTNFKLN